MWRCVLLLLAAPTPASAGYRYAYKSGALPVGNDIAELKGLMTLSEAERKCSWHSACCGITFSGDDKAPDSSPPTVTMFFKSACPKVNTDTKWHTYERSYVDVMWGYPVIGVLVVAAGAFIAAGKPKGALLAGLVRDGVALVRSGGRRGAYTAVSAAAADPEETASAAFRAGDRVEYFSSSKKEWIATKVKRVGFKTIDLEAKKGVPPDKVRAVKRSSSSSGKPKKKGKDGKRPT